MRPFYVQEERSVFLFQTKLSTYVRIGNSAGAWMHESAYVQENGQFFCSRQKLSSYIRLGKTLNSID